MNDSICLDNCTLFNLTYFPVLDSCEDPIDSCMPGEFLNTDINECQDCLNEGCLTCPTIDTCSECDEPRFELNTTTSLCEDNCNSTYPFFNINTGLCEMFLDCESD